MEDVRLEKECVSAVELDLPRVTCQMRPTSLPHYSQNGSPLRHTTSDGLDRTESVVLWGFPPNHHEEAALVTTAALSIELCYQAVIEERDQRHIGNPLVPAIKLLDRYIQRFIRQKARGQWKILLESSDSATNLALLVSLEQGGWQVVEPATKYFNRLRGKNPQAHLAPPSTRRSVWYCLPDGAL